MFDLENKVFFEREIKMGNGLYFVQSESIYSKGLE